MFLIPLTQLCREMTRKVEERLSTAKELHQLAPRERHGLHIHVSVTARYPTEDSWLLTLIQNVCNTTAGHMFAFSSVCQLHMTF